MLKKILITLGAAGLALAGIMAYTLREPCQYDPAQVAPSLQALVEPFQKVSVDYYMDGGSIGVAIKDRDGKSGEFLLTAPPAPHHYQNVLSGVHYPKQPGGTAIDRPDQTRRRLLAIIVDYGDGGPDADMAILALRGHPWDRLKTWIHRRTDH